MFQPQQAYRLMKLLLTSGNRFALSFLWGRLKMATALDL